MSALSLLINNDNVEINEGKFIYADSTQPTVDVNGRTYLRSGILTDPAVFPLANIINGKVGASDYTPNLYFRVA